MKRWMKIGIIVMFTLSIATIVGASDNDNGKSVGSTNLVVANQTDRVTVAPVEKDTSNALFDRDFDFPADLVHKMHIGIGAAVRPSDFAIPD